MIDRANKLAPLMFGACALLYAPNLVSARQTPASTAKAQDVASEFDALVERYEAAQNAYSTELRALNKDFDEDKATAEEKAAFEKKSAELEAKDPSLAFVKEFEAFAEHSKGTDSAVKALIKVIEIDHTEPGLAETSGGRALSNLLATYIKSPQLTKLPTAMARARSLDSEQRKSAFKKLKSDCPLDDVKASAMYSLGNLLLNDDSAAANTAEARQLFVDLKQQFGALASPRRGRTYGTLAESVLFELDHLQIGSQAPDFEVVDETGAKFKLSDYRGKVVVIDFWGNW
jgi:hypothetical protein